jgi:hypothetical protein
MAGAKQLRVAGRGQRLTVLAGLGITADVRVKKYGTARLDQMAANSKTVQGKAGNMPVRGYCTAR